MDFSNIPEENISDYSGLRLCVYTDNGEVSDFDWYDIINMTLSVHAVTADVGGVSCTARVVGGVNAEDKDRLYFPDYGSLRSFITVGKSAKVVLSRRSGDSTEELVLLDGIISAVSTTEESYANVLRNSIDVAIVTPWDFLDVIPKGMLLSVPLNDTNTLMAESLLFSNKSVIAAELLKNINKDTTAHDGNNSSINVAKAIAAIIDYIEGKSVTGEKTEESRTPFQSAIDVATSPCLRLPKSVVNNVFQKMADKCAELMRRRVPNRQIITSILSMYYMYFVPRLQMTTAGDAVSGNGIWKPHAIPDNPWNKDVSKELTLTRDDIISFNQGVAINNTGKFSGVAVRFHVAPQELTKGVSILRHAVYAHSVDPATGEIEEVSGISVSTDGKSKSKVMKTKTGRVITVNGSLLSTDLPSWLAASYPGTPRIGGDKDWRMSWAELVAKAEFAKNSATKQSMSMQISSRHLDKVINMVGDIISINVIDAKDQQKSDNNTYARLAGITFTVSSTLTYFRTSLTLALQCVRSERDQKKLSISNNDLFHVK